MKVCFYEDSTIETEKPSMFLAGPTPREKNVQSWRDEAIQLLREMNFDGTVYIPESKTRVQGAAVLPFNETVEWEQNRLNKASAIVFWIPREIEHMPAFTTNVEFGIYYNKGNAVYGRPKKAPKCKYLDYIYERDVKQKPSETLKDTLSRAILVANKAI